MDNSPAAPLEARFQLNESDIKASEKLALQGTKTLTLQRVVRAIVAFAALVFVASVVFNRTMANRAATPREAAIWNEGLSRNFVVFMLVVLFLVIWKLIMLKKRSALYKNPMLREPTSMTFDQNALTRQCDESLRHFKTKRRRAAHESDVSAVEII